MLYISFTPSTKNWSTNPFSSQQISYRNIVTTESPQENSCLVRDLHFPNYTPTFYCISLYCIAMPSLPILISEFDRIFVIACQQLRNSISSFILQHSSLHNTSNIINIEHYKQLLSMLNFLYVPFFGIWTKVLTHFVIPDTVHVVIYNFKIVFPSQPSIQKNANTLPIT